MRVLVCGSREWSDAKVIYDVLYGITVLNDLRPDEITIIEGQCPVGHGGADRIAQYWAEYAGTGHLPFPGERRNGRFQGPERNQRMLDEGKPDLVFAFKDGFERDEVQPTFGQSGEHGTLLVKARGGTEDMVRRAKAAGIPTYIISHA